MIEALRNALDAELHRQHDGAELWHKNGVTDGRIDLDALARAAIQALSEAEPTQAMLAAGEDFCVRNGMAGCFHNMLRAALE